MSLPAVRAFALHACLRKRCGCSFGGPDYADRDHIAALKSKGLL